MARHSASSTGSYFWLIEHHPESEITLYYARSSLGSTADYDRARNLWLEQVAAHPNDARVLAKAAYFIGEKDQFTQEDLLKRARDVDPSNPEWAQRLAFVFARAMALSFWAPVVPPVDPSFAVAAKAELEISTDSVLVGTVGEFLAGGAPAGSPPRPAQIDYAEHLINRALSLDASNLEWSSALTRLRAASENLPEHRRRVVSSASAWVLLSSNLTCSVPLIPSIRLPPSKPGSRAWCAST